MNILFVCTGNTCRSPMASEMLKSMEDEVPLLKGELKIKSVGTFAAEDISATPEAVEVMDKMGLDIRKHRSAQFCEELADWADVILTMEAKHIEQIEAMVPKAEGYTHTLLGFGDNKDGFPGDVRYDIPDPYGEPYEEYEECAEMIKAGLAKVVVRLSKEIEDK